MESLSSIVKKWALAAQEGRFNCPKTIRPQVVSALEKVAKENPEWREILVKIKKRWKLDQSQPCEDAQRTTSKSSTAGEKIWKKREILTLLPAAGSFVQTPDGEVRRNAEGEKVLAHTLRSCSQLDIAINSPIPYSWVEKHLLGHMVPPVEEFRIPTPKGQYVRCKIIGASSGVIGTETRITIIPPSLSSTVFTPAPPRPSSYSAAHPSHSANLPDNVVNALATSTTGLFALTTLDVEGILRCSNGSIFRAQHLPPSIRGLYKALTEATSDPWLVRPDTWGKREVLEMLCSVSATRRIVCIFDQLPRDKAWNDACRGKIFHLNTSSQPRIKSRLFSGPEKKRGIDELLASFAAVERVEIPDLVHSAVGDSSRAVHALFEMCVFARPQPCALVIDDVDVLLTPCDNADGRWERDVMEELCRCLDDFPTLCVVAGADELSAVPRSLAQRLQHM